MDEHSNHFLNKDNVELIWEVIYDENIFQQEDIHDYFVEQLHSFHQRESMTQTSLNLIEMNKKFIEIFLYKIKQKKTSHQHIATNQFVTAQDIQNERKNKFDIDLNQKKSDFDSAMNITIPKTPIFTDTLNDEPIGNNMEMLIAQTLAQRNLELEKIHNANGKQTEQIQYFLQPQETSIKNDKNISILKKNKPLTEQREIKYIQIGETVNEPLNTPIIDLNERDKKHISWSKEDNVNFFISNADNDFESDTIQISKTNTSTNIFSKLKKVNEQKGLQEQLTELTDRFNDFQEKMDYILKKIENM
jgi:hypothetical protein